MKFVDGAYHVTLEDPARRHVGERLRLRESYFVHGPVRVYDGQRLLGEFKASPLFEVAQLPPSIVDGEPLADLYWRVLPEHDDAHAGGADAGDVASDEVAACD